MRGGGWNSGEARAWVGREEWTEEKVRGGAMAAHTHLPLSLPLPLSLSLARGWNVPESFEEAVVEMDAEAVEAESGGIGRGRSGREEEEEEEEIGGIRWRVEVWEVVGR